MDESRMNHVFSCHVRRVGETERRKEAPDQESGTCTATEQTHHPTTTTPRPEPEDSRLRICNDIATNMDMWVTQCTSTLISTGDPSRQRHR